MMFRIILLNLISILLQNPIESFVVTSSSPSAPLVVLRATGTQNDILKVPYEIEPIGIRIGHGFDIDSSGLSVKQPYDILLHGWLEG